MRPDCKLPLTNVTKLQLKPVRKIKPSSRSITGKHSSKKTCSVHYFESSLERDFLILLEWDEDVVDFVTQPLTINYTFEGQQRHYTPDVMVYYKEQLQRQPSLCEIKYSEELVQRAKELKRKFDAANEYCLLNGYQFKIITEKEIRTEFLGNIKFLSLYNSGAIDEKYSVLIYEEINKHSSITPKELVDKISSKGFDSVSGLFTLWQLIAQRQLRIEMESKITMNSKVWKM